MLIMTLPLKLLLCFSLKQMVLMKVIATLLQSRNMFSKRVKSGSKWQVITNTYYHCHYLAQVSVIQDIVMVQHYLNHLHAASFPILNLSLFPFYSHSFKFLLFHQPSVYSACNTAKITILTGAF